MLPVFIYVFEPAVPNTVLKRIGSFESRLAGSSSNIVCLLYSGTNHYDVIDDPVFVDRSGELCLIVSSLASNGSFLSKSGAFKPYIETRLVTKSISKKSIGHEVSSVKKCHKKKQVCKNYRGPSLFDYRKRAILASKVFISQLSHYEKHSETYRERAILASKLFILQFPRFKKSISTRCHSITSSDSILDAKAYSKNFDMDSMFIVCAIYGCEVSRKGCVLLSDVTDLVELSGISSKYSALTVCDRFTSTYDVIFHQEMDRHFEFGLLRGVDSVCKICYRQLRLNKKKSDRNEQSVVDDNSDDDGSNTDPDTTTGTYIPELSLFRGLFTGSVPDELIGLTHVEESMISIYSAVSNIM